MNFAVFCFFFSFEVCCYPPELDVIEDLLGVKLTLWVPARSDKWTKPLRTYSVN